MKRARYSRSGLLAIDPRAMFVEFDLDVARPVQRVGDVAIVDVCGPLEPRDGTGLDSYESIVVRVELAASSTASAIVMRIDSPGGAVAGCFDTARKLRKICAEAGKPLYAYVDGMACSAAYALACAAQKVYAGETSIVGSIGVIEARVDVSASDAAQGVRFAFVASGARKADGCPHLAISDEELASTQVIVDSMAGAFFGLVSEHRAVRAEDLKAMGAKVFTAMPAVVAGLVDDVMSFDGFLASLAGDKGADMRPDEEVRAMLEGLAGGDDEDMAKRAKRALAALDEPMEDTEKVDAESEDDEKVEAKAEGDDMPADDKGEPAAAGSVSASTAGDLAAIVSAQGKQIAALMARNEKSERTAFLASRPDLDASLRGVLASKPLVEVREIVNAIPKPKSAKPAASAVVKSTRGEGQGQGSPSKSDENAAMDHAMGITRYELGARREGTAMVFGVMPVRAHGKDGAK